MSRTHVRALYALAIVLTGAASAQSGLVSVGFARMDSRWFEAPFVGLAVGGDHTLARTSGGEVVAFGLNGYGECNVPSLAPGVSIIDFAAGIHQSLLLLSDGTVVAPGTYSTVPALPAGTSYVAVVGSYSRHFAALRSDGTLVCWGQNFNGECNVPALPAGVTYGGVAIGYEHTLGRRSDGTLAAWGANFDGQCNVPALPAGVTYQRVAAGRAHSAALRSDGVLVCWGNNNSGQCNVPSLAPGITFVGILASDDHMLAVLSDGSVIGWGANDYGELTIPAAPPGTSYVEVDAGPDHTLLRRSDGASLLFGSGTAEYLFTLPPRPPGVTYVEVSAGSQHLLARRSDGQVVAWGVNNFDQCVVPPLPGATTYTAVAAGGNFSVAVRSDGSAVAWGSSALGALAVPSLPAGTSYVAVAAGQQHGVALRSDGDVVCWGWNQHGQCNVPVLPPGVTYVAISASQTHTAAVRSDGSIAAWGLNNAGQCNPPALPPGLSYVGVAAGSEQVGSGSGAVIYGHSLALRSDGSLIGFGASGAGQLGVPPLPPGASYISFDAGGRHSVALRDDGAAFGFGSNGYGECDLPMAASGTTYVEIDANQDATVLRWEVLPPQQFCTAGTTSNGCVASITAAAHPSVSYAYPCALAVSNVAGQKTGLFFYGIDNSGFAPLAWGAGTSFLCVKSPSQRTPVQSSAGTAGACDGSLALDWNAYQQASLTALGQPWLAGSKVYAQAWFRDPPAPKGTQLSNAIELTYQP